MIVSTETHPFTELRHLAKLAQVEITFMSSGEISLYEVESDSSVTLENAEPIMSFLRTRIRYIEERNNLFQQSESVWV